MDADVTAILAAIDAVSNKVDDVKTELKADIHELRGDVQTLKGDVHNVQKTVDKHTLSLQHIVHVVAGPMPAAINNIEEKLGTAKTDFPLRSVPAEIAG